VSPRLPLQPSLLHPHQPADPAAAAAAPSGMTKQLHLFEPRYMEMLEEVLASGHRLFTHAVVEQPATAASARRPGAYATGDFVMCMATLVKVGAAGGAGGEGDRGRAGRGQAGVACCA
jgi:hypothetical protein